ncbi:MAG: hypothetical protein VX519_00510 [Myxococcota bacterium]|nr:hypothetical protein [Myxococcota bacterium]
MRSCFSPRGMLGHVSRMCGLLVWSVWLANPVQAGWWDDIYDYWASGEMGESMLNSVGVSAEDIVYSVDHPEEFAAAVKEEVVSGRAGTRLLGYVGTTPEKVANTIDVVTDDPCAKGPTIFDDLKSVVDEVTSGRAGEAILNAVGLTGSEVAFLIDNPHILGDAIYDEWASGRAGERLLGFGEGLGEGALETVAETADLVGDGLSYAYIVATTETLEQANQEFKPSSQVVELYKNSDDPGATTAMLLSNLADLPGQLAHDIAHNPHAAGKTIGSFAVPVVAPRGIGALSKGARGLGRRGGANTTRAAVKPQRTRGSGQTTGVGGEGAVARQPVPVRPKSSSITGGDGSVSVRVATHPKGLKLQGSLIDEYHALKPGPLSKTGPGVHPANSLQGTFSGGRYASVRLSEPRVVYRLHNNGTPTKVWNPRDGSFSTTRGASETGAFWSLERPAGAGGARIDSAVLPEWGNSMTHMTAVKLPAGTVVHVGEVGAQGGYFVGGGSQLVVEGGIKTALQAGAKVVERTVLKK